MLYTYIVIGIIAVCLAIVVFILIRKIPKLKTLDVATITEEKEAKVKERIIAERMKRKAEKSKKTVQKVVGPFSRIIKKFFAGLKKIIVNLEKKYQKQAAQKPHKKDAAFDEKVKSVLHQAEELVNKEEYSEAEKKFIEIISLDSQNKKAYQGLANLYLTQKEYKQAIQIIKYVLKLDLSFNKATVSKNEIGQTIKTHTNAENLNEDYIKLGEVYLATDEPQKSLTNFQNALQYTPNDPKTLDLLIETSLILRDKLKAIEYFERLSQVNPDNQKLLEYK